MYTMDRQAFVAAMKKKGYRSVQALAKRLNIHRNTINYYLSGREVISEILEKILNALDLDPQKAFIQKNYNVAIPEEAIANLIDELHQRFSEFSFLMFGSRTGGRAHKYSDFDIGVFKSGQIPHGRYQDLLLLKNELEEGLPVFVDMVNLNHASSDFLRNISKSWIFLTGKQKDWVELKRRVLQNDG